MICYCKLNEAIWWTELDKSHLFVSVESMSQKLKQCNNLLICIQIRLDRSAVHTGCTTCKSECKFLLNANSNECTECQVPLKLLGLSVCPAITYKLSINLISSNQLCPGGPKSTGIKIPFIKIQKINIV